MKYFNKRGYYSFWSGILFLVVVISVYLFRQQLSTLFFRTSPKTLINNSQISKLQFDKPNTNCVPAKNTPGKKITHFALGVADFYDEYNKLFAKKWKCLTGEAISITQAYFISGELSRKMAKGSLSPDIVTLSNPAEMDLVANAGLISKNWRNDFPFGSSPYYSSVVFAVRKNNPKDIKDWNDLIKPNLVLLASNPKTCGGGRWVYTAALGNAMKSTNATSTESKNYLSKFYANFPIIYPDQGKAGDDFIKNGVGDVLVTYEKFAQFQKSMNKPIEVITPSRTVAIDITIAIVEKFAKKEGVEEIAKEYINGLYDPTIQKLIAKNFFRPRIMKLTENEPSILPKINLFTHDEVFGKDNKIETVHLGDGGIFDSLTKK